MMHRQNFLMDAMGDSNGMSRSARSFCSAIIDDAEDAREFDARASVELLGVMPGCAYAFSHRESSMSPAELTSLIA